MKIIEHQANSHTLRIPKKSQLFLMVSDVHFDSKDCRRDLLKKHFDHAKANDGLIMIFGDWFDVMGCYKDPRSKGQDVRPEYLSQSRGYLDLIVEDSFNFLKPYKDNLVFMGYGNHETAIIKHRDTDILNTLIFLLRQEGANIAKGGYSGYLFVTLQRQPGTTRSQTIAYHHGYGGNSPRSKGILKSQMDTMVWSDADIIVSGHDHNKLHDFNICYKRNPKTGEIQHVKKHWLKLGNYKRNEKNPGVGGWAVEKGFMPKPLGGYYMEIEFKRDASENRDLTRIDHKFYEAD